VSCGLRLRGFGSRPAPDHGLSPAAIAPMDPRAAHNFRVAGSAIPDLGCSEGGLPEIGGQEARGVIRQHCMSFHRPKSTSALCPEQKPSIPKAAAAKPEKSFNKKPKNSDVRQIAGVKQMTRLDDASSRANCCN